MITRHSLPDRKLGRTESHGDGKAEDLESSVELFLQI